MQLRLSQKKPLFFATTSDPQRGHTPMIPPSLSSLGNRERYSLSGLSCVCTKPVIISVIPFIKPSALSSPRSICFSLDSHSAVRSGDLMLSGSILIRFIPVCVGISSFFLRSTNPVLTSFSRIAALVAGVPKPLRSASSGVSSAPAVSIAESNKSSV